MSPGLGPIPDESIVMDTWSKPPGLCLIPSLDLDHNDRVFQITIEPPRLSSPSIVIGIDDDDGAEATWSEPLGLGPISDESIVIEIPSEPPGLCSIPSEHPLSTLIASHGEIFVADIDIDLTLSVPPGLGSIMDEPIVIKTWSKPPGLASRASTSIDDGIDGTARPGEQYKKIRGFGTNGVGTIPDE